MSGIVLNLVCEPTQEGKSGKSRGNSKHKRFLGKRHYLEHKGLLKEKQNKKKKNKQRDKNKSRNTQLNGGDQSKPGDSFPKFTSYLPNKTNEPSSSAQTSSSKSTFSVPSPSTASTSKRHPTDQAAPHTLGPLKYVALDCEMVGTGPRGCHNELARCSIVNYEGDVIYDKYIKPINPVTDFRTPWSGIRRQDLFNAVPFKHAQKEILKIITGKVVVGHAIINDFKALKYYHPPSLTRDTSLFPLLKKKAGMSGNEAVSLKKLTKAIFNKNIQTGKKGHSSVEDARATMELFKVVENMWEEKTLGKPMDPAPNQKT